MKKLENKYLKLANECADISEKIIKDRLILKIVNIRDTSNINIEI